MSNDTKNKHALENNQADIEKLKSIISSMSINGEWFKRNLRLIGLIMVGLILYITNRYQAQQEVIAEETFRQELEDWKFRCLTRTSELTLRTRQSQIEKQLRAHGDTTLLMGTTPPFELRIGDGTDKNNNTTTKPNNTVQE